MGAYTPTPLVEIGFGFGPFDNPGVADWIDVTDYVNSIETSRGRQSELDTFPAGTATINLDNHDRRFDPLNTSSPYNGDLVANTPIRIRADLGAGGIKPIWYGVVDSWPNEYSEAGFKKDLDLPCSDLFKVLSERAVHDTMIEDIEGLPGVLAIRRWYRFDRVIDGEQVIRDRYGSGQSDLIVFGQWSQQERVSKASTLGALGLTQHQAPENVENRYYGANNPIGPFENSPIKTDSWAIALTFRVTEIGEMGGYSVDLVDLISPNPGGLFNSDTLHISLHHGGQHHPSASTCPGCIFFVADSAGIGLACSTGPGGVNDLTADSPFSPGTWNPFDGEAHSLVCIRYAGRIEAWGDGVLVGLDVNGAAVGIPPWDNNNEIRVYWPKQGVPAAVGRVFPGVVLSDIIFMDPITLGSFDPVAVHEALMLGTAERTNVNSACNTLLSRVGQNVLMRAFDTGEVLIDTPANFHGWTALELLQQYADSEGGRVFMGADGKVVFHAANRFETQAVENTVQYTFSDLNSTNVGLDGTVRIVVDDEQVYERAEVERINGYTQEAQSTASPAKTYSIGDLRFINDRQSQQRAERIVFLYSTPKPRTEAWDVWPEAVIADWDNILDLDIGHRVAYVVTPGGVGSQISLSQHIELIEHHITAEDWSITMNGSPVDSTNYLQWGGVGATQGWGNGKWR